MILTVKEMREAIKTECKSHARCSDSDKGWRCPLYGTVGNCYIDVTDDEICANYQKMFEQSTPNESNNVDHPSHYNQGGIECIDAMVSAFGKQAVRNFCICNAFKYTWRADHKNGIEDLDKAQWYLNKYKELLDSKLSDTQLQLGLYKDVLLDE